MLGIKESKMNPYVKFFRVRDDGKEYEFTELLEFAEDIAYHKRHYGADEMPYKWYVQTNNGIISKFELK